MKPFLDFYRANRISPVAQDISDMRRHFDRREALYRHLAMVPAWLRGRSVLEFGPGSGFNALHTASLEPGRYLLVDGNPTGLAQAAALLREHVPEASVELVECLIEDFGTDERFDLVLCEGTIPFQMDPPAFLRHVASFAAPGGMVVTTCVDGVSMLAETLRRLAAMLLVPAALPTAEKVARLMPVFSPHLATLRAMSRPHEDWILDQLVQPLVGRLLSVEEAIDALDAGFDVHGSSPRFLTDWRWYKDIHGSRAAYNTIARDAYLRGLHNLIDYRQVADPRPGEINRSLLAVGTELFELVQCYEQRRRPETLEQIRTRVAWLPELCDGFAPATAQALGDFLHAFEIMRKTGAAPDFGSFAGCFGRGQQYLSFIRR